MGRHEREGRGRDQGGGGGRVWWGRCGRGGGEDLVSVGGGGAGGDGGGRQAGDLLMCCRGRRGYQWVWLVGAPAGVRLPGGRRGRPAGGAEAGVRGVGQFVLLPTRPFARMYSVVVAPPQSIYSLPAPLTVIEQYLKLRSLWLSALGL